MIVMLCCCHVVITDRVMPFSSFVQNIVRSGDGGEGGGGGGALQLLRTVIAGGLDNS